MNLREETKRRERAESRCHCGGRRRRGDARGADRCPEWGGGHPVGAEPEGGPVKHLVQPLPECGVRHMFPAERKDPPGEEGDARGDQQRDADSDGKEQQFARLVREPLPDLRSPRPDAVPPFRGMDACGMPFACCAVSGGCIPRRGSGCIFKKLVILDHDHDLSVRQGLDRSCRFGGGQHCSQNQDQQEENSFFPYHNNKTPPHLCLVSNIQRNR